MCDPVIDEGAQSPAQNATQMLPIETQEAQELPNAVSGADAPTPAPASAPNADGSDITLPTDENFNADPLHVRVAQHLEAIYQLVREAGL